MYKADDISSLAPLNLNEEQAMVITNLDDGDGPKKLDNVLSSESA